ncbi:MAG: hypothetical protein EON87_10825 [Brevundimonas sp.]|nr:MAG: hypothetical protein EON87_10825 [Brevundimonas sp.]
MITPFVMLIAACTAQAEMTCSEISEHVRRAELSAESLKSEVAALQRVYPDQACDDQCAVQLSSCLEATEGNNPGCYQEASDASKLRTDEIILEILGLSWRRPTLVGETAVSAWEAERASAFRAFVQGKNQALSIALSEHASALSIKIDALRAGRCSNY